jgi:hypothetical protein
MSTATMDANSIDLPPDWDDETETIDFGEPQPEPRRTPEPPTVERNENDSIVEKRLLEQLLQSGKWQTAFDSGLQPDDFTVAAYRALVAYASERDDKEIDKIAACLDLRDSSDLSRDALTSINELDDLGDGATSTGLLVPRLVREIRERAHDRKINSLIRRAGLLREDDEIDGAVEMARQAVELAERGVGGSLEAYASRKYDPKKKPAKPAAIVAIRDIPVLTVCNIATCQGGEKSGKSHVAANIARAVLGLPSALGITSEDRGAVAYVDAEQSTYDFWELLNRSIGDHPDFHAWETTGDAPAAIKKQVADICRSIDKLKLLIIDGYADLVTDVNDPAESNELVAWLMRLARKHQIAILGIIHLNPGAESKTRGHLGSQLTRKCESTIQVDLDGETRILYTARARHRPIVKSQGLRFEWSDDSGGFVEIEGTPAEIKQAAKLEEWTRTLRDIEAETGMLAWKFNDLVGAIQKAESLRSPTTAKNRIKAWLEAGILRHDSTRGTYLSTLPRSIDEKGAFPSSRSTTTKPAETS